MYRQFDVVIGGPKLMMHNAQLSDPLNKYAKALKMFPKGNKKSDEDIEKLGNVEFEGGLYHDPEIGPYIPDSWLNSMMVEGARRRKLGRLFEANVCVAEERHKLEYTGPRDIAGMLASGRFTDRRGVVIGTSKVMRVRPLFRDWKVGFRVNMLECEINAVELETAIDNAGPYGIGDGRPMLAGKFAVISFKESK